MDIRQVIEAADDGRIREHLIAFLTAFTQPAFGALPKREVELKVFELLRGIEAVDEKASIYSLMTDLRITRAEATQMLFDLEVRSHGGDAAKLDNAIREALRHTKFAKDGDYFVLEIESPLVLAHLRQRIREAGHVSDTSFNTSIVRAPVGAVADLISKLVPKNQHGSIKQALVAAGAKDDSFKGVLVEAFKSLGSKALGGAGDRVIEFAADKFLDPILSVACDAISEQWKSVFHEDR